MLYRQRNSIQRFWLTLADGTGGLTGKSPTIAIQRKTDGQWLNAAGNAFAAARTAIAMVEHDAVNEPGAYRYDFDQAVADGGGIEDYLVTYDYAGPPVSVEREHVRFTDIHWDAPFSTTLAPAGSMHEHQVLLRAMLQGNFTISATSHDANNNMTGATLKFFATKADLIAGAPILYQLVMSATYNANNEMSAYSVQEP